MQKDLHSKIKTIVAIRDRLNSLTGAKEYKDAEYVTLRAAKELYEESLEQPVLIVSQAKKG
tara:strand:+ start:886 stop:1068 length:183 start_codon:yes stop_codon:yes gene_type:complete